MGFRITTNMMINSYRYNLHGSTKKLSDSIDMVLTGRNYNSYAEDPASATQEFRLRRTYYRTYSQLNNNKSVYSKYNTAWNNLSGIKTKLIDETAIQSVMRGDNGPTGEARRALATTLRETSESLIYALNQKLGDQFIFAGNDALNVPFEWKGEDLYYRGINVNSGGLADKPIAEEPTWLDDWEAALKGGLNSGTLTEDQEANYKEGLEWIKYYRHETDTPPNDTDPTVNLKNLAGAAPNTKDEEWIAYYAHQTDTPPTADPKLLDRVSDKANKEAAAPSGWSETDETWYQYLSGAEGSEIPEIGTRPQWVSDLMEEEPTDAADQAWLSYYRDKDNYMKLKEMSGEEMYIDLGMGLAENAPNDPVNGSYFNSALCGIDFIDFGVDEDGDPKNLALLMREFADVFQAWDEDMDPQGYNPELAGPTAQGLTSAEMEEKAYRLLDKFKDSREHCVERWDELDAESVFLVTNQERLETQLTDTNTEILDVSQVDLADAITSLSWQQYCYNAALKIGNQLLSQSLIDYMR